MACYMNAKLSGPLGLFCKKLVFSNMTTARPSTCLSLLKSQEPHHEIWSGNNCLDQERVNCADNNLLLSFDHTNKNDNSNQLQQLHFEIADPVINQGSSDLLKIKSGGGDSLIQDTDKQEILNYLQTNLINHCCIDMSKSTEPKDNSVLLNQGQTLNSSGGQTTPPSYTKDFPQKPTEEQLTKIYLGLSESLPRFFFDIHNYGLYNKNIVFQNGIRGVTIRGLQAYIQHISWIKILCHLKYARVKMEILKITKHEEDGTIRVRWRIVGISGMRAIFFLWKLRPFNFKKNILSDSEWIDGFSIFHVGSDGLIYKHMCDKMMPDENRETVSPPGTVGLKLAMIVGLSPSASTLGNYSMFSNAPQNSDYLSGP